MTAVLKTVGCDSLQGSIPCPLRQLKKESKMSPLSESEITEIKKQLLEFMDSKRPPKEDVDKFLELVLRGVEVFAICSGFVYHFERQSKRFKNLTEIHIAAFSKSAEYKKIYKELSDNFSKYVTEKDDPTIKYDDETEFDFYNPKK